MALTATFVAGGNGSFTFRGTTNATPLDSSTTQTSRLAVTTGGTINASTGVLLATAGVYTEGTGATKTADARLDGRVFGAGGVAVAGLFTTTSGATTHVGGFVGVGPQVASDLYSGSGATGNSIGQANRSVFSSTEHSAGRILFLGDNYETRRNGLNVASDTARNQHILSSLGVAATGGGTIANTNITQQTGVSVAHGSPATTASATIWQDGNQAARLFAFGDLLVAGGKALSGTLAAATYQYEGVLVSAPGGTALGTLGEGRFSLSAEFSSGSFTFTGTIHSIPGGSSQTSRLVVTAAGGGTVNVSTGVLLATAATYTTESAGTDNTNTADARLDGRILGLGGDAVAGLFTTTSGATTHVGGFVGEAIVGDLYAGSGATGNSIGQANRAVFSGTFDPSDPFGLGSTGPILFLGDNYAARRDALISSSETERSESILSNLGVAATGIAAADETASGSLTKYTGVSVVHGNPPTTAPATIWQDSNQAARLFAFSDLFVVGGWALSGTLSGPYHYEGAFISALSTAMATVREGTFSLTANFTAGSFTFRGTTNATPLDSSTTQTSRLAVTTGGRVNRATGVLLATAGVYTEGTGATKTSDARLDGRVFGGGGVAVAGLFTTISGATTHVGGFVGEAIARDLHAGSGATGNSIGQAIRSVFSGTAHSAGRILFLGNNYETRRNGLYVASDTARNQHILSSLGVAVTGAGTAIGNLTKHTGVSVAHGSPATTASATIWQDSNQSARLFVFSDLLVAGGKALSGTPAAGTHRYEGVFVSASGGTAFGTLREGTFSLSVEFSGGGFSFTGTTNTTDAGGSSTQTSRLAVGGVAGDGSVRTGTVNASTGVLLATTATYTEGTGTGKTADARFDGRIFGAGGVAVAGLFTTTSGATTYVGGFVGAGPQVASDLYTGSAATGNSIGQANISPFPSAIDPGTGPSSTGTILFLGDSYAARRDALNSPSDTVRNESILSRLVNHTGTDVTTSGSLTKVTGTLGSAASAGTGEQATIWHDSNFTAQLFAFSDLFVAGGRALSGTLSGTYHYEGVFISARSTALATFREGTFALTATFVAGGNGSFTFTGTTNTTPLDSSTTQTSRLAVTTGGSVNRSTGVLLATAGVYTEGAGTDKTADARLHARIFGVGGDTAAGLFTTISGATTHVGAFVGSNPYPITSYTLSTVDADLHSGITVKYGIAAAERTRTATHNATAVKSDIVFISSTVATDVSTSSASNQDWLTSTLDATLTDDATRADFSGAGNQTHTKGRTGTGIIAYETTRGGSNTRMYFVDNAGADRLLLEGPEYDSKTYLTTTVGGRATAAERTLHYTGRVSMPETQVALFSTPPTTVKFTATLIMTPTIGAFKLTSDVLSGRASSGAGNRAILEITASLDVDTGRLTSSDGILFRNGNATNVRDNAEVFASEGFVGQVYGDEAESIGGVYWGVQPSVGSSAAYFNSSNDAGRVFTGGFIGTKNP